MSTQTTEAMRELDSRVNDGLHVQLLWGQHDGRLAVSVTDMKTGVAFSVDVPDGARSLDVFHHPFAYAA
jgi:hypothetical protein